MGWNQFLNYPTLNSLGTWIETLKVDNKLKPHILLIMLLLQCVFYYILPYRVSKTFFDAKIPKIKNFLLESGRTRYLLRNSALRPTYAVL